MYIHTYLHVINVVNLMHSQVRIYFLNMCFCSVMICMRFYVEMALISVDCSSSHDDFCETKAITLTKCSCSKCFLKRQILNQAKDSLLLLLLSVGHHSFAGYYLYFIFRHFYENYIPPPVIVSY